MARNLTTPVPQEDVIQQAISGFAVEVPHIRNAGDTAMEISKPQVKVTYEVITYDADGNIAYKAQRFVRFEDWPAGFITDMKAVYDKIAVDAENAGLIGPGTDDSLEP